jgi:drug/metabolite transporter (DMT)-like permease
VYALGLSLGQVFFKLSAQSVDSKSSVAFVTSLMTSIHFYIAMGVYALITILWIWILTRVPLNQAYPFVGLAFVFTPALGVVVFGESIDLRYVVGVVFVLVGAGLIVMKPASM